MPEQQEIEKQQPLPPEGPPDADSPGAHPLVEVACSYWFHDNERVRTPFPKAIQKELREVAAAEYASWEDNLSDQDRKEVTDDEMASVFESFLFGKAIALVKDDLDQILTIYYPFMPRLGDTVADKTGQRGPSRIISREVKEDKEKLFMKVALETDDDAKETWETEFEIPS